jgi:hypothetical protein
MECLENGSWSLNAIVKEEKSFYDFVTRLSKDSPLAEMSPLDDFWSTRTEVMLTHEK